MERREVNRSVIKKSFSCHSYLAKGMYYSATKCAEVVKLRLYQVLHSHSLLRFHSVITSIIKTQANFSTFADRVRLKL